MPRVVRDYPASLQFNGGTQYGKATAVPFAAATQVTIHLWVKLVPTTAGVVYESSSLYSANDAFHLSHGALTATGLYAAHADATHGGLVCAGYTAPLPVGVWMRVTHVIDQTVASSQGKVYVDGVIAPLTYTSNQNCTAGIATKDLFIAMRNGASVPFAGGMIIDRITIGKAYTAAEVLAEYQNAQYPSGGTVLANYDWTIQGNLAVTPDNGTGAKNIAWTNSPLWVTKDTPGKRRRLKYEDIRASIQIVSNLSADRIAFGNSASLQLTSGTFAFWAKIPADPGATGTFWGLAAKDNAWLLCFHNGALKGILGFYDWNTSTLRIGPGSCLINDDQWHHIAFVFQSGTANGSGLYLDGDLAVVGTMTVVNQATGMSLGNYTSTAAGIVGARYASAVLYNVAMTTAQVRGLMDGVYPTTGLVSRWKIDELTGTVVADSAGANPGSIT